MLRVSSVFAIIVFQACRCKLLLAGATAATGRKHSELKAEKGICRTRADRPAESELSTINLGHFTFRFGLLAKKAQQFGIDFLCVRPLDAVWGHQRERSCRKSSCQVGPQARLAAADAPAAMFQLVRTTSSLTRLPKSRSLIVGILDEICEKRVTVRGHRFLNALEHAGVGAFVTSLLYANLLETNEYRTGVGAHWPFLSDAGRTVQKDLDIAEYTDPAHNPMIPPHDCS
jgi:hypothetical protein